jgi:hypothetical protein
MKNAATILHFGDLGPSELNAIKIAQFMGLEAQPVPLTSEAIEHPQSLKESLPTGGSLITNAQTLWKSYNQRPRGSGLPDSIRRVAANVFVYGFEPTEEHSLLLRALTSGGVLGVKSPRSGDSKFQVATNSRNLCRQFADLEFGSEDPGENQVFVEGLSKDDCASVIRLGHSPFLTRLEDHGCQVLLSACREIADLDAVVDREVSILRFFPSLVPLMMFMASAHDIWHNDAPRACFIVDDPLLKEQYGFLNFRTLLGLMERARFCTSIAFIPWNFRRSDRSVAGLFAANPHRYSLCIHGCDHTGGEFGADDVRMLRQRAEKALDRMARHRELSGLGFDDVMVFPQGIFSRSAMKALKSCGYLAAVNTTPYPVDQDGELTLHDLLQVAVTRFSNFPIFTRRYPQSMAELAFDLFLGKPALIVEHHGFFRDGYEPLAEMIEKLYSLDERLQWESLGATCSQASLKKAGENGSVQVQFFTNRFHLRNESGQPQDCILVRRTVPEEVVRAVIVNGSQVDICHETDSVTAELTLNPGQVAEVGVEHDDVEPTTVPGSQNRIYEAKVFLRRSLSEFRDNYVARTRF